LVELLPIADAFATTKHRMAALWLFGLPPRIRAVTYMRAEIGKRDSSRVERKTAGPIGLLKETKMPQSNRDRVTAETGEQVPARPHDSGSAANETVDGLDATTEAIRHAAEDTPTGTGTGKIEKIPVFDRADLAPKI
jgi:hypothetical protein